MTAVTIGCSASLDTRVSVHATTFTRAIELACEWLAQERSIQVVPVWVDDGACSQGGLRAATEIIQTSVRAVVGHFSSAAALAAAPVYASHGLSLFAPAATAARLSSFGCVYRLCDPDESFAQWICAGLRRRHWRALCLLNDGSAHGTSVCDGITRYWGMPTVGARDAEVIVFSGMLDSTVEFVRHFVARADPRPLLLTDDAQSDYLVQRISDTPRNLRVMGFKTGAETPTARAIGAWYQARWGASPGIYFFETVAAVQVAAAWMLEGSSATVKTVLGTTCFDSTGESRPGRFACHEISGETLKECGEPWD